MAFSDRHVSDGTSTSIPSWTPTANGVALLTVEMERSDGVQPAAPTSISGNGAAWAKKADLLADNAAGFRRCGYLYEGILGASPTTGGITVTLGYSPGQFRQNLDEIAGADPTTPLVTANIKVNATGGEGESGASATTRTVTMDAFASASNGTYVAVVIAGTVTSTPKSGFTELGDAGGSNLSISSQWKASEDSTPSVTFGSAPFGAKMAGVEVSLASSGTSHDVTDTGAGADSVVITVSWATTDSGTGTDSTSLSAALSGSETGAGTDQVGQSLQGSDSGSGSDTAALSAALSTTDSGAGTDSLTLAVAFTLSDTGAGADTGSSVESGDTEKSVSDQATGLDEAVIVVVFSVSDDGQSFDVTDAYLATKRTLLAVKTSPVGQMIRGGRRR